jgi:hypothetical protein
MCGWGWGALDGWVKREGEKARKRESERDGEK